MLETFDRFPRFSRSNGVVKILNAQTVLLELNELWSKFRKQLCAESNFQSGAELPLSNRSPHFGAEACLWMLWSSPQNPRRMRKLLLPTTPVRSRVARRNYLRAAHYVSSARSRSAGGPRILADVHLRYGNKRASFRYLHRTQSLVKIQFARFPDMFSTRRRRTIHLEEQGQ